jgi:hydroxymethylpyrimidine pyrophosphatase-like HAD family hydrolase
MKSHTAIMGLLAVVALAVGVLSATGCAGTKAAYNAADTLEERAYVVTEHYAAVVHQAADLKDKGVLKGTALTRAQEAESVAQPVVLSLGDLVKKYDAAKSAESEVALQRALDDAVRALADLVRVVKAAAIGAT